MITLIVFAFFVYGLSNVLVHSSGPFEIFTLYRHLMHKLPSNLGEGSECMICTPFQIGLIVSLVNSLLLSDYPFTPCNVIFGDDNIWFLSMIIDGSVASGVTWLIHTCQEHLENNEEEYYEEENEQ